MWEGTGKGQGRVCRSIELWIGCVKALELTGTGSRVEQTYCLRVFESLVGITVAEERDVEEECWRMRSVS